MPEGSQQGLNINEADTVRKGLATAASEDGASQGDAATVGPDGELLFAAGGGSQPVTVLKFPLSAAQLLALSTAGLTLVAAPGVNKYLRPLAVDLSVTQGGTPFGTCDLFVSTAAMYNGPEGVAWSSAKDTHSLDGATATISLFNSLDADGFTGIPTAHLANQPLVLIGDPAPTVGNGSAVLVVTYVTVSIV